MPGLSNVQRAKRAFVVVLRFLATAYGLDVSVNRDSPDAAVTRAFRKVALRVHPDKGGSLVHSQELLEARDAWQQAITQQHDNQQQGRARATGSGQGRAKAKAKARGGGSARARTQHAMLPVQMPGPRQARAERRIRGVAVLLTYQGFPAAALSQWRDFKQWVEASTAAWGVKHWCATMETNQDGTSHMHAMLQFHKSVDCTIKRFIFRGCRPNDSVNDYLGQPFGHKNMQASINRGMFYVYADKIGTQREEDGTLCVAGDYKPAWERNCFTYAVQGKWPLSLWHAWKLTHDAYESYLFLCRDNVVARKRNLDAVREQQAEALEMLTLAANVKRVRSNPALYRRFPTVPAAAAWLLLFGEDRLRYPLLVVKGQSFTGKTEWAKSLFDEPLEVKIGNLSHFPEAMRTFDRTKHDGLVLDDVRDLRFLTEHQHALQGKYDARVEFASTPGGTCAYKKYLFAVPTVVTINYSTKNLDLLLTDDWLKNEGNRTILDFPDVLHSAAEQ